MTHRGAVGADTRDGDGAGVMTSIPHKFMTREFEFEQQLQTSPTWTIRRWQHLLQPRHSGQSRKPIDL